MGYIGQTPSAVPLDGDDIADDIVDSQHYVDGSVDLAHMSSQSVDEDNIHISNAGSNGQFLSKQSGNAGGLTWADAGVTGLTNSSNTTWMTVSADEEVNLPLQPAFQVQHSGTQSNVTGNSATYTCLWDTETFDIGSNFASNTFTAPITGKYLLTTNVTCSGVTSASDGFDLQILTSNRLYQTSEHLVGDMDVSDTATVRIIGTGESGNVWDIGGVTPKFSGVLLA